MEGKDKLDQIIEGLKGGDSKPVDSDLYKAFRFFVSKDEIMSKTKITPEQRNCIYVFEMYGKRYPGLGLETAAEPLMLLFISEGGESRKGMIELFKGMLQSMKEMPPQGNNADPANIKGRNF